MFALAEVAQPGVDRALVLSQLVDNAGLKAGPSKKETSPAFDSDQIPILYRGALPIRARTPCSEPLTV